MSQSVIIDTDPGIDDAIAILFALSRRDLDIRALTTVAGNIGLTNTTRNALKILALAGRRDVPVFAGAAKPLCRQGIHEEKIHGIDGLGGVCFPEADGEAQDKTALYAMNEILSKAPNGSVDLYTLGPLTNIAHLIQQYPTCAQRIGKIISMGGAINDRGNVSARSEFNFANDPEAAAIVLESGIPLTLVPLDVTRQLRADMHYVDRLLSMETKRAKTVGLLIKAYFADLDGVGKSRPLHDPCVPLFAVAPELFETMPYDLSVDLHDDPGALNAHAGRSIQVAHSVKTKEVLDLLAFSLR